MIQIAYTILKVATVLVEIIGRAKKCERINDVRNMEVCHMVQVFLLYIILWQYLHEESNLSHN